jgi:branched-chain amino acid transport system permease protein
MRGWTATRRIGLGPRVRRVVLVAVAVALAVLAVVAVVYLARHVEKRDEFVQLTVNGLTLGSVYALIALGYSLVYGILKLLNFAHGDVFMVGSFIGFGMLQLLGGSTDPALPLWPLLIVITVTAMVGCALLGVVIERFAYRPLRDAPRIAPLISALGVSFFIAYSMQTLFGADQRDYDAFSLDGGKLFFSGFDIGNVRVPLLRIVVIGAAFVLMLALWLLVTRTRTGKAMKATSYDREAAAMMGIDIDRVIVVAFVLGSALAGAAGVLFALRVPTFPAIGFLAGLKGFTAAVIGGIGSIPGAMAGGLILGFAEAYTQGYISTKWSDLLVFVILIGFMIFRPQGLFGRPDIKKV